MRIAIWTLEPKYKNLALEKVRLYHQGRGDIITDNMFFGDYDITYCSAIFDWTPLLSKYAGLPFDRITKGGTGFDLVTKLPPEIDSIQPHLNFGFTTRGCFRNCPPCVVHQKEGDLTIEGDLLDLWDGKSKSVVLYDNNVLGLPEHFALINKQARDNNISLDWNQGLDHRCLTPEIVDIMKSVKHHEYRFAFDHPSYINSVDKAITLLQDKGINRCSWYVLVGFNTSFTQDLFRVNYLRNRNQLAYVQRYRNKTAKLGLEYIALARWVNQHHIFRGMTWQQFLAHPDNKRYQHLAHQVD